MPGTTRVVAVIPARYASRRLPAKPLVDLLGKPMVQRVYERVRRARLVDRVVVATDDRRIAKVVEGFGGEVVMTSSGIKSGSDRVAAVARKIRGDIFVNVQGDEPLMAPKMIDQAVQLLLDDPQAGLGTLAKKIESAVDLKNPAVVKVVFDKKKTALYFSRSVIPHVRDELNVGKWLSRQSFYKHIGIYVFRRKFLATYSRLPESALERSERLEQLRVLENGYSIKVGTTRFDSIPIDTPADVRKVRALIRRMERK
ncbi:MAG: 3-deoxy-manno-octulosonate cytidylyltransferase [Bacteroidota bacterium]